MASIKKIEGKGGTSYKITVTKGTDYTGKQIRHYKTWKPDRPMTARQMEREVKRVALDFEREIEWGFQTDSRKTFKEYAHYVISLKKRQGAAKNTIIIYEQFMKRVAPMIGHMKLSDIRPQHLNALYEKIPDTKKTPQLAKAKIDLSAFIAERGTNKSDFAKECGVSYCILWRACDKKNIKKENAEKIAGCMNMPVLSAFDVSGNNDPISPNTIRRLHSFLSIVFAQAEKEMLITYNPAERATPPAAKKTEPVYLQPDELRKFLALLDNEKMPYKAYFYFLATTGCRRGEALALKWDNMDFENQRVKIDHSLNYFTYDGFEYGPTKTRNTRYISLPEETVAVLKKCKLWQTEQRLKTGDLWNDEGYIFTRWNGLPIVPQVLCRWLKIFTKKNNLPDIHPHSLRHTFASILIANGIDIVTVANLMGHTNANTTTGIYSHLIYDASKHAAECVAGTMLRKKNA